MIRIRCSSIVIRDIVVVWHFYTFCLHCTIIFDNYCRSTITNDERQEIIESVLAEKMTKLRCAFKIGDHEKSLSQVCEEQTRSHGSGSQDQLSLSRRPDVIIEF